MHGQRCDEIRKLSHDVIQFVPQEHISEHKADKTIEFSCSSFPDTKITFQAHRGTSCRNSSSSARAEVALRSRWKTCSSPSFRRRLADQCSSVRTSTFQSVALSPQTQEHILTFHRSGCDGAPWTRSSTFSCRN